MGDRFRVLSSTSTRDLRYSISHPSSLDAIHQCSGKIHHHPTGEVTEELAAKYGVYRATLWRWAKTEVQVNEAQRTKREKKMMSKAKRGVKLLFPLLEARLLEWLPDMRKNKSMCVTSQYLLLMAVHFEPEYLTGRSLDAAVASIRSLRLPNLLSVIVRDFIKAGIVLYGPRYADGKFVVEAPEELDDTVIEEEDNNNED
ncbi:hypothetical protein PI125_g13361 [Phytophthora idaei]|nr:hypothetical protein PI125_g13361 [Phytophthora idaei]KAG3149307.1 hypothetical protein PI126_g12055 [Phytophthora idaei]